MKTVLVSVLVLVLVVVAGVAAYFYGENAGFTQAQNIRAEFFASRPGSGQGTFDPAQAGQNGSRGAGGQGARAAATGTVKSVQGETIIVSQRDGSTVTVTMNAQTQIQKTTGGTAADVQPGMTITVLSNQTGSNITAQTIQLRPAGQ